jgi:hypothetical protein
LGDKNLEIKSKKSIIYVIFSLFLCVMLISITLIPSGSQNILLDPLVYDEDIIIYTANQGFFSRIYILDMNGSVLNYFEYENFHFCDTEVVNNELYVAEAFAPRVEKVNLDNGDLDVIVDDWSLFYFYDLAFDGTFFYVDEWDMNRYYLNGSKDGTGSFDQTVFGSTWDGSYLWTLTDNDIIKCWDVSNWPILNEIDGNNFNPPSPHCRGLWFDGQYFWTAESYDDSLGYIYQFNYQGDIINQWIEPAFSGWSACVIQYSNDTLDIDQPVFNRGFPIRHTWDGDWGAAQNFTATLNTMASCEIYLRKFGSPEFNLTAELRIDHPEGSLLDTLLFTAEEIASSWQWLELDFDDIPVEPDTNLFIVLPPAPSTVTTSFGYEWGYAFGNQYWPGSFWFTRDGGGLWRDLPTMYEFVFKTYGYS